MKLRLICICLILFCVSGCVASKARKVKAPETMLSLPEARKRIVAYHESGKYDEDTAHVAESVSDAAIKAIKNKVKYPAVVMVVEDVLLSTYEARSKQGFADNPAAVTDLESHVILSSLPAVKSSIVLFDFLQERNIPVFLVSYRPEGFRVPVMENLSKVGFSGWKKIFMKPLNYPDNSNFSEEVRRGLQRTGYNIIATIGVLPEDISGEFAGKAVLYPNYIYSKR
ncbi:HAD family acid phosphatase [Desulfovibrio sp. JC010]|uniref:HAD family acid phosphatase n=1 Tax=Desulfovibrio sp. JC010 TaxID=2593641 RepID=UPI0013D05D02|nr:HAD family acid phosphatase [Desulfovibrio sp. JC010]NDV27309.1 acid phosphatase [Desulfovibrio sp. JC010]